MSAGLTFLSHIILSFVLTSLGRPPKDPFTYRLDDCLPRLLGCSTRSLIVWNRPGMLVALNLTRVTFSSRNGSSASSWRKGLLKFAVAGLPSLVLLAFDYHSDRMLFPDRTSIGKAFQPRLNKIDYPGKDEDLIADARIAYILVGAKDIVFLGGDSLNPARISEEQWANFHHYFVEIRAPTSGTDRITSYRPTPSLRNQRN